MQDRKPAPLQRGGTLQGAAAAGKDASEKFKSMAEGKASAGVTLQIVDGRFRDYRWKAGRWDLSYFKDAKGEMDWDAVIDAEMARRKLLEDSPIPSTNEEAVVFDTSEIPWWAWVRRFHLPEVSNPSCFTDAHALRPPSIPNTCPLPPKPLGGNSGAHPRRC